MVEDKEEIHGVPFFDSPSELISPFVNAPFSSCGGE
jgi:hypothetical protein